MQTICDILVVDDDEPTIVFIAEALRDEGYTVHTALAPADARAVIVQCHPDLVLLDLHLPGKTGDILVQDLKDDGLAHIPIILMTADAQAAQELSMEGFAYCLLKPFDLDELIDCVAKHIRRNCTV
jgi:two-component system alkaline phosphatase synthesis response regulator PhoP